MYALVAQMHAEEAAIAGMVAENQLRLSRGEALAYTGEDFNHRANCLMVLAEFLAKI